MSHPKQTLTIEEAEAILVEMMRAKDASGKQCRIPIEIVIYGGGRVAVEYQPPKIRMTRLPACE